MFDQAKFQKLMQGKEIAPKSPFVVEHLQKKYRGATHFSVCRNDEAPGWMLVYGLQAPGMSMAEALVGFFKLDLCFSEEWPYEEWTERDLYPYIMKEYNNTHKDWARRVSPKPEHFVERLKFHLDRVMADLGDNHSFSQAYPDQQTIGDARMHELSFVSPDKLVAVLTETAGELEAIFHEGDTWYLVSWFTTA